MREKIEAAVRNAYAARLKGDIDGMMRHFSDAPHFSLAGSTAASPVPVSATGAAAVREVMRRLVASFEFLEAEIVELIVDGDRAAVHSRIRFRPVGSSGDSVQTELVDILRFDGDRIASFKQFADTALAAKMLGH